ncbi:hypothetical protein ElyMa_006708300 [Elysia marginata]|uniref:Uncharacterized protein n=1 Tax=Elysia marginata TaxID=1093978 RepID=A0AAV4IRX8_9GAST|nr:hypothetical protein ElyMa_006708300 [Elysia marginata]
MKRRDLSAPYLASFFTHSPYLVRVASSSFFIFADVFRPLRVFTFNCLAHLKPDPAFSLASNVFVLSSLTMMAASKSNVQRSKLMTLLEVLSIIEDEADKIEKADVYIMSAQYGQNSEEDSGGGDDADGSVNRPPK